MQQYLRVHVRSLRRKLETDPENPRCAEDSAYPAAPDSDYGWEKLFSERLYAAYQRNYGGTVKEIRKALRVNEAFKRVLDDPGAAEALQHPALKPLLDEAAE